MSSLLKETYQKGVKEIKRFFAPVRIVGIEQEHPKYNFIINLVDQFPIRTPMAWQNMDKNKPLALAELQGTVRTLYVVGDKDLVAETKFYRAYYTTPEEPLNDKHAFLRLGNRLNTWIQDAHFYENTLLGTLPVNSIEEIPVASYIEAYQSNTIQQSPYSIMFLGWLGRRSLNSQDVSGITVTPTLASSDVIPLLLP